MKRLHNITACMTRRLASAGILVVLLTALPVMADDRDALIKSAKRGDADANLELARLYFDEYDYESASGHLDTYRRLINKGRKKQADRSGDLGERIDLMETMLASVEDIAVIDSIVVDKERFFEHYGLSADAGHLSAPDRLPRGFKAAGETAVFMPHSGRNIIWGAPVKAESDSTIHTGLAMSWRLYGDEWETPTVLDEGLALGGNANWPFMAPDGVTLYYASDGEGSLGGYDIFKTRRSDDGYFDPVNMGMPYNSPYDDYMLAIDETNGIGWWATDRNRIPGKVTIYVFVPEPVRSNINTDDDSPADRGRITAIRDSWRDGADYSRLRRRATQPAAARADEDTAGGAGSSAALAMPDGTVCTSPEQLRSNGARAAWTRYAGLYDELAATIAETDALRLRYAGGDRNTATRIRRLEGEADNLRSRIREAANSVIKAEIRR